MTSLKLQNEFKLIEIVAFVAWQKADARGKEKICRELGRWEAKKIINEIEQEVKYERREN